MSKAFTKEDDSPPERSTRRRSEAGLPPGAIDYLTSDGAARLRAELAALRDSQGERASWIRQVLAGAVIVEPPAVAPQSAVIGSTVRFRSPAGEGRSIRLVGVHEAGFEAGWTSWTSPLGRALLAAEPGQSLLVPLDGQMLKCVVESVTCD